MFGMFKDYEIITNLRKVADKLEENDELKSKLYVYMVHTKLYPTKCDCEIGTDRFKCKKCNGFGYYLSKEDEKKVMNNER